MEPFAWDYIKHGFRYDFTTNEFVKNELKIPRDLAVLIVDPNQICKLSYIASKGFKFVDLDKSPLVTNDIININVLRMIEETNIDNIHSIYREMMKQATH